MSKDKNKSLPRRLALLSKIGGQYGYALSREGRPPANDKIVQDCVKRGLIKLDRDDTPGFIYPGHTCRTTKARLTEAGHAELKKYGMWSEFHAVPRSYSY